MVERFLAVDLGNSRCKAGLFVGGDPTPAREWAFEIGPQLPHELDRWLGADAAATAAALCSVAAARVGETVAAVLAGRVEGPVEHAPDPGLELAVDSPESVGADRLFAARGALERVRAAAIVVDAGTALTVDAVRPASGAADACVGSFLGGAIAPGPELLASALARGGARLPPIEPRPGAAALGRDTPSALAAGVAVGFEGAALRLVEGVAREAGLGDGAPVVLTGGARGYLLAVLEASDRPVVEVDPLVLLGLFAARAPAGAQGP